MEIILNKSIINTINNEINDNKDLISFLDSVIDEELLEDEPDCDLIDNCVNTIIELEGCGDITPFIRLALTSNSIKKIVNSKSRSWKQLNRTLRIAIIAAIIATSTFTVNAAVGEITGKTIAESINSIIHENKTTTKPTTQPTTENTTTEKETEPIKNEGVIITTEKQETINSENPEDFYIVKDQPKTPNDFSPGSKSYKSKGNTFDHLTYVYDNPSELPQNFDEKVYMQDYYPENICYENEKKEHEFTEWKTTKKPTCGVLGEKVRSCNICGWTQTCPIKATGNHSFVYDAAYGTPQAGKDSKVRATCKSCSLTATTTLPVPKKLVLDTESVMFNGRDNTRRPKVIAVLDRKGYEIPKQYYTIEYDLDFSCSRNNYVSAEFYDTKLYSQSVIARFVTYPPDVEITSIYSNYGGFTACWKKPSYATIDYIEGYQIEYSRSQNFENSTKVNVSGLNSKSKSISGLSSDTTYYVRVRAYYSWKPSTDIYGNWSATYAIKVK